MPQLVTGTRTSALTLSNGTAIIAAGAAITADGAFGSYAGPYGSIAVYGAVLAPGALGQASILNAGLVAANGNHAGALEAGILLAAGGFLTNAVTGTINAGPGYAVAAAAVAGIINQGSLSGGGGIFLNGGVIDNAGLIDVTGDGVNLTSAAYITNSSAGSIISTSAVRGNNVYAGIAGQITATPAINNAGLIAGQYFGIDLAGTGTVINTGTIAAKFGLGYGVALREGGFIRNAGGLISGGYFGAELGTSSADTIINAGTIAGFMAARQFHPGLGIGAGLYSNVSNQLTNTAGGVITGAQTGVSLAGHGGSVVNAGLITGAVDGIRTGAAAATIINAGTIAGGVDAVTFAAGFAGRLIVEPGADFSGVADGGNAPGSSVGSVLEFSGTLPGTVSGIGSAFIDFATIIIDPGANWRFAGTTALDAGQTLIIEGSLTAGAITGGGLIIDAMACFAAGTRILGPRGQIPVEFLAAGDRVVTAKGEDAPIKWIGRRTVNLSHYPHPEKAQPIRIAAGAIADNSPARDLYLSPDHALFFENHLIPAKALLNNRNVRQEKRKKITYYHIELEQHAIIFAENTAVESYLETGNRACFENAPVTDLYPVFDHEKFQALREQASCAPLAETGPVVDRLRIILLTRAFTLAALSPSR